MLLSHTYQFLKINTLQMLILLFIASTLNSLAQSEKKLISDGNKNYETKNYIEAEKKYKAALEKNKESYKANFNLGNAYYQQGRYEEAAQQFQAITHKPTSKDTLAKAYHNLGNALLKSKKYQESVNAYKNALKNNPNDEDTRYNLAYALQMLKKQQEQEKKDKENKQNQDKKEDEKKEEEKKNEDKKEKKQDQQPEQAKQNISKEDAERMLDALLNDEKNIQDKLKKQKAKGVKVEIEKDW